MYLVLCNNAKENFSYIGARENKFQKLQTSQNEILYSWNFTCVFTISVKFKIKVHGLSYKEIVFDVISGN